MEIMYLSPGLKVKHLNSAPLNILLLLIDIEIL